MRNLKRALSLALASVMLLGMMVVGTSAASYPDVDENDNVEAIEVLNAVQVMIGDRGNFRPDAAVNRHEMAVIMAKLVLGVETADNYVGSHPFTDVFPWADKYVAACYENGLVSGTSATTFSGSKNLTAVQAAAMMLRALGYKDLSKGASDWRAPVTSKANLLRLFQGVASNPNETLNRNQVAQLALNTLKSPMVNTIDGTFDVTSGQGGVVISGGARTYETIVSGDAYATAISDVEGGSNAATSLSGYAVELGEHLYNGKLRLISTTDAFQRPARQWEYDGKQIGTYVKDELLRQVWTEKVTGKMIYDVLTKSVIEGSNKYDFTIAVDGVLNTNKTALGNAYFDEGYLNSNHKSAVGGTGNGVTTEVYVDSGNKQVYISVINTYLAKATGDYNATRETATYNVYGLSNKGNTANPVFVKTLTDGAEDKVTVTVSADDFNIADVKKDDIILVNVADGTIQIMEEPEVMASASLSAFAKNDYVVSEGSTIKYNNAAEYDFETLDKFTGVSGATNLRDKHYNLYLDKNGYLAGIEAVEEDNNYIFLTGIDAGNSDLKNKTADAAGILMDGTFVSIKVNMEKSKRYNTVTKAWDTDFKGGSMWNTWCTYSVDNNGVYTLKQVCDDPAVTGSGKVAQFHDAAYINSAAKGNDINIKNYSLRGTGSYSYVYGNESSVYMTAKMGVIMSKEDMSNIYSVNTSTGAATAGPGMSISGGNDNVAIINGVDTRTVGIANTDMTTWTGAQIYDKFTGTKPDGASNEYLMPSGVYTLFNNKGYVVASIVIGEDNGIATNLVLVNSKDIKEERFEADSAKAATAGEWVWSREVIDLNTGEVGKIYEKGDTPSVIDNVSLPQYSIAQIKLNGDNYVTGANKGAAITGAAYETNIANLENTISTSNKDLVAFKSTAINADPSFVGNTLHVDNANDKGVPVHPDVKTVLIKTTDGASETTEFSGSNELDTVLATLNKDANGKVSFEIYALIKGGQAITIVIRDRVETNGQINNIVSDTLPITSDVVVADTASAADGVTIAGAYDFNNEKLYLQFTSEGGLKNCTLTLTVDVTGTSLFGATSSTKRTFTVKLDGNGVSEVVVMDYAMKMGQFGNVLASIAVDGVGAPVTSGKVELDGDLEAPTQIPNGGSVSVPGDVKAPVSVDAGGKVEIGSDATEENPSQVTEPVTGGGTTEIAGPTNGGNNVMTEEVVAKPGSSFTGTIGDADSGNPSNLTFSAEVDEVDSVWNVSGSVTVDHDIDVTSTGGLNAPEIVVKAGKTLNLDKTSTFSTMHITMKAGSTLAYYATSNGKDDPDGTYTFTKDTEIWYVNKDEDGTALDDPYVQITWAGGDTACAQSSSGWYKTIRNIINAMKDLDA